MLGGYNISFCFRSKYDTLCEEQETGCLVLQIPNKKDDKILQEM
jgi:hypothetical protein